jgi:hypothetical protein
MTAVKDQQQIKKSQASPPPLNQKTSKLKKEIALML